MITVTRLTRASDCSNCAGHTCDERPDLFLPEKRVRNINEIKIGSSQHATVVRLCDGCASALYYGIQALAVDDMVAAANERKTKEKKDLAAFMARRATEAAACAEGHSDLCVCACGKPRALHPMQDGTRCCPFNGPAEFRCEGHYRGAAEAPRRAP